MDKIRQFINNRLPDGSFARNVVTLMTGTTFAQTLTVIVTPILTRIYKPEDFGILGIYTSIMGVMAIICCGRYEQAIVLPEKDEDASNLGLLSILWTIVSAIFVLIIIIALRREIGSLLKAPNIVCWLWVLPINILFIGMFQTLNYWNTRFQQYKVLAARQMTQSFTTAGTQLGLGFLKTLEAGGLIVGQLIGLIVATVYLISSVAIKDFEMIKKSLSKQKLRQVAIQYKKYPIYSMLPSVLDSLTVALPVIFFTKFFDLDITGQYSLGVRLLYLPASLIGAAVAQVYFQKLAEENIRTGNISDIVWNTCKSLFLIVWPFCLILMILGPWLFTFFFGANWMVAGQFCRILAPSIGLRFVVSPLSRVFGVVNRQEVSAFWQVLAFSTTTICLGLSLPFQNAYSSVISLMLNDLLIYSLYLFLIFRVSGIKVKNFKGGY